MKSTWAWIFLGSFAFNLLWEHLHYPLYLPLHPIVSSWYSLWLAAVIDGLLVAGVIYTLGRKGIFVSASLALLVSIVIEIGATYLKIWEYGPSMYIIPILGTGLSPTVQLAVTMLVVWPLYRSVQKLQK